jgi:hypothetical protein
MAVRGRQRLRVCPGTPGRQDRGVPVSGFGEARPEGVVRREVSAVRYLNRMERDQVIHARAHRWIEHARLPMARVAIVSSPACGLNVESRWLRPPRETSGSIETSVRARTLRFVDTNVVDRSCDNLDIFSTHIPDESVDVIHRDPLPRMPDARLAVWPGNLTSERVGVAYAGVGWSDRACRFGREGKPVGLGPGAPRLVRAALDSPLATRA